MMVLQLVCQQYMQEEYLVLHSVPVFDIHYA